MVIYKYELPNPGNTASLLLPKGANVLSCGQQRDRFFLWALVEPANKAELRYFGIFATGQEIPEAGLYGHIGRITSGPFEWHVLELVF